MNHRLPTQTVDGMTQKNLKQRNCIMYLSSTVDEFHYTLEPLHAANDRK